MDATNVPKYFIDIQTTEESKGLSLQSKIGLVRAIEKLIEEGVRFSKITFTEIIPKTKHV